MCAVCLPAVEQTHCRTLSETQHRYLHIAVHHPSGVVRGLLKGLEVGEDLGHGAQQPQRVEVGVGEHWLLLLQALPAQFHNLEETRALSITASLTQGTITMTLDAHSFKVEDIADRGGKAPVCDLNS